MNNQNSLLPVGTFTSPWHIHMGVDVFIEQIRVEATLGMNIFSHMSLSVGAATCTRPVSIAATMSEAAIVCSFAVAIASESADLSNTMDLLVVLDYISGYLLVRGLQVAITLEEEEINGLQKYFSEMWCIQI